jgi:hypothetical protein
VTRTELFFLHDPVDIGTVADDHVNALGREFPRRGEHMTEKRPLRERVQHLRQGRSHARALPRSEDDHFEGHGRSVSRIP